MGVAVVVVTVVDVVVVCSLFILILCVLKYHHHTRYRTIIPLIDFMSAVIDALAHKILNWCTGTLVGHYNVKSLD